MKFSTDFEKNEFVGREALKQIKIMYPDIFSGQIEYTNDMCVYDAFYFIYDKDYKIKKRVFIEIKVREKDWDEPFLEYNKWNDITNIAKNELCLNNDEYEILYINFLPSETIVWKIKDMNQNDLVVRKMNKATCNSRSDKKDKKVWLMNKSKGKQLNYILNQQQILSNKYNEYISNKIKEVIKKKPGLEDILFY